MVGLVGGILGALVGVVASFGIGALATSQGFVLLDIQIELFVIVACIVFAFSVGMLSGYLPARDAAKMLPVEALRE